MPNFGKQIFSFFIIVIWFDCERSEAKRSFASLRSQESFMLVYRGKLMYAYLENEAFFEYAS